jgi:G3E family GTPase
VGHDDETKNLENQYEEPQQPQIHQHHHHHHSELKGSSQNHHSLKPLETNEFVQAISTLLTRANLPIDLDKQKLLEQIQQLRMTSNELQHKLHTQEERCKQLKAKKDSYKNFLLCGVCQEKQSDSALIPCGHVYCLDCISKLHQKCPKCRKFFERTITIYTSR